MGMQIKRSRIDRATGTVLKRTWISSMNIVSLFADGRVPAEPDYVSIDLDSADLFIMHSILASGKYRPRVISIEYNSNFEYNANIDHNSKRKVTPPPPLAIVYPDAEVMSTYPWEHTLGAEHAVPGRNYSAALCYMGASAGAIAMVAEQFGYAIVNATRGLDLFLVRKDVWGSRPIPALGSLHLRACINAPMTPAMAINLIDYRTLQVATAAGRNISEAVCAARRAAAAVLRQLAHGAVCSACFKHLRQLQPAAECATRVGGADLPHSALPAAL